MTRIKICGLTRAEDVRCAIDCGADYLGFVREPTSPRFLDRQRLQELLIAVAPTIPTVSVYGDTLDDDGITTFVQAFAKPVSTNDEKFWRVHRLRENEDFESLQEWLSASPPEVLVLDAYDELAKGGTGKILDWKTAAKVVENCGFPVVLAGGLSPANVAEAVEIVRPFAVDVSSGVEESPGIKCHEKVAKLCDAVRRAS